MSTAKLTVSFPARRRFGKTNYLAAVSTDFTCFRTRLSDWGLAAGLLAV
jgi:hypothetical protein